MMNFFKNQRVNLLRSYSPLALFLSILFAALILASCKSLKPYVYLKDLGRDTTLQILLQPNTQLLIQKGDILSILVSSLNRQEDEIFNVKAAQGGYEVDDDGFIYVQRLGKIRVEGITRLQLKQQLENDLKPFLKDPLVAVNFSNHKVTIIGSVNRSQVLQMPGERITLYDALAQSGNVMPEAQLSKVIIVRDSGKVNRIIKNLNLEDKSLFASSYYYLQPNDVVMVNPDAQMVNKDQDRLRYQQFSTIIIQTITLGVLIYQTFFR